MNRRKAEIVPPTRALGARFSAFRLICFLSALLLALRTAAAQQGPASLPATAPMPRSVLEQIDRLELGNLFKPSDAEKIYRAHQQIERYFASSSNRKEAVAELEKLQLDANIVGRLTRLRMNWQALSLRSPVTHCETTSTTFSRKWPQSPSWMDLPECSRRCPSNSRPKPGSPCCTSACAFEPESSSELSTLMVSRSRLSRVLKRPSPQKPCSGPAVLRHRVIPNFNADAEGVTVEQIIQKVLTLVPRGRGEKLL